MNVTLNSTFNEVPLLDKVALAVPHIVYSSVGYPLAVNSALVILLATSLLVVGSYASVSQPKLAKDPNDDKDSPLWDPTDRDNSPLLLTLKDELMLLDYKTIGVYQALCMPVFAGSALFGLNYVMKRMNIPILRLLSYYAITNVAFASSYAIDHVLTVILRNVGYWLQLPKNLGYFLTRYRLTLSEASDLPLSRMSRLDAASLDVSDEKFDEIEEFMWEQNQAQLLKMPTVKSKHQIESMVFDLKFLITWPLALLLLAAMYWYNPLIRGEGYHLEKINWIINNAGACSLTIVCSFFLKIGNFKVGTLLLSLLFFYDIYFVFKSEMMIAVATGIDLPFKLVFPRSPLEIVPLKEIATKTVYQLRAPESLLGLGDIVVPGAFASLALRFDYHQYYAKTGFHFHKLRCIGLPRYFTAAVVSYIVALIATLAALHLSGHGQPALLFIVPSLLIGLYSTAYFLGELQELWHFSEELKPFPKEKLEEKTPEEPVEDFKVHTDIIYEFGDATDESDDTYVIEDETENDDDSEDEDLMSEIANLVKDQSEEERLLILD